MSENDEKIPEVVVPFQGLSLDPGSAPAAVPEPVPVLQPPTENDNNNERDKIWCRLLIPSKVAGAIIGKGGQTIKSLRDEYQAIINIPEARSAPERVLKICVNSREKLNKLVSRIAEILKDEIMKSGARHRREGETELRILVQSSQAGAIIGTKGSTVKNLRESTGSRININPECCPNSTERVAAIMGRPETVVKCISKIYDILEKVPPKGSEQRYDPNCFDPSYDYGGFGYNPNPYHYLPRPYYHMHPPGDPRGPSYIQPPYGQPPFGAQSGPYGGNQNAGPFPIHNPRFSTPNSPQDYSPGRSAPGSTPATAPNLGQPSMAPRGGYGGGRGGGPSTHSMMRGHRQGPR